MNGALWTAGEIAAALGVGASSAFPMATGVSIDSRTLTPGDLFIAIRGEASDGHDYVASAFLAGAIACVIAPMPPIAWPQVPFRPFTSPMAWCSNT